MTTLAIDHLGRSDGASSATADDIALALARVAAGEALGEALAARLTRFARARAGATTAGATPYVRAVVHASLAGEVMVATWRPGGASAPHDHGAARGLVLVARGELVERRLTAKGGSIVAVAERRVMTGDAVSVAAGEIHEMEAAASGEPAVTLHLYAPRPGPTRLYDRAGRRTIVVDDGAGAWLPPRARDVLSVTSWPARTNARRTIWVGYTTLYREGGPKFARVARTMGRELARAHGDAVDVVVEAIESKADFVDAMARIAARGGAIEALHFIGHSGMYGPMFRTTAVPEQFSPHEWRSLSIPFAEGASATFHCCRSARWFAPFFARTFGVVANGYHLYTTFSARPDRFVWEGPLAARDDAPLYVVALPGKKSHGVLASLAKYARLAPVERLMRFEPPTSEAGGSGSAAQAAKDGSYDTVADLYDRAFADIGVRRAEVSFIEAHLPRVSATGDAPRVLELGAGNGALLARLAPRIATGLGVDASRGMVARAEARFGHVKNLRFAAIDGPTLPAEDASIDVVVSMLSWRYLDWDPMMAEIRRVLAPGGRLIVVDMVALPVRARDGIRFAKDKLVQARLHVQDARFRRDLRALVAHPAWAKMLAENPIRAEHEYRWYFESRFPGRRVEVLTVAYASRVVAFDSGPLARGFSLPQSYP